MNERANERPADLYRQQQQSAQRAEQIRTQQIHVQQWDRQLSERTSGRPHFRNMLDHPPAAEPAELVPRS